MLAGLLCLMVLVAAFYVLRVRARSGVWEGGTASAPPVTGRWLGAACVLLGAWPLLSLAPWVHGTPDTFWGDAASHARVSAELARSGLPRGWLDSYLGGFPFGHHYPQLGWLLLAAGIRAGLSPAAAVHGLGFLATLALPVALYFGLVRCKIRPTFAWLGATLSGWVSPYNAFVGGYETFFSAGLVSQALVMPLCVWLVVASISPARRWEAPVAAWLSMASHPQVTVAAIVILSLAALSSARRPAIVSALRTGAMTLFAGAALYGQGIASLDIPFGWPPDLGWRQFGFPPQRLGPWLLDGELLDLERPPVTTALLGAAALVHCLELRRPECRAVLIALLATLLLSVSGRWLLNLGGLGAALLSFLQPLRIISLVPLLLAATVALALERAARQISSALQHDAHRRLVVRAPAGLLLVSAAVAGFALPSRADYAARNRAFQKDDFCEGGRASGYDRGIVMDWVAQLSRGRLWYDAHSQNDITRCAYRDGIDVASAVPVGTAASVGAHVGILARAAQYLDPLREGSASRAEALGIGHLLVEAADSPLPGWRLERRLGSLQLLSRRAVAVGVGCVRRRWTGGPRELRTRLNTALSQPTEADRLLDPSNLTAIEYAAGPVAEDSLIDTECDASLARVSDVTARAGSIRATVHTSTPADVVFRFTAFPTWTISVDGVPAGEPSLIAPGFFSVRVSPGTHVVSAEVGLLPGYSFWIAVAAALTVAIAALPGRRPWTPRTRLIRSWLRRR